MGLPGGLGLSENTASAADDDAIAALQTTAPTAAEKAAIADTAARTTIYVDGATALVTGNQNGSRLRPYKTIQQALDAVPVAATVTQRANTYVLDIASGDYDESPAVDVANRRIWLAPRGAVRLGVYEGAGNAVSGTRRNFTITGDLTPAATAPIDAFTIVPTGSAFGDFNSIAFRISGKLDMSAVTGATGYALRLRGVAVDGTTGANTGDALLGPVAFGASNAVILNTSNCNFYAKVTGNFSACAWSQTWFYGAVSVRSCSLIHGPLNAFLSSVTINSGGVAAPGIVGAYFAPAAWVAPGAISLDAASYAMLLAAGVTISGGGSFACTNAAQFDSTVTAGGTTGARTINKPSGTVNLAAAGTSLVVTNSYCSTSSIVFCVLRTNDTTCRLISVVPGSGSFTINCVAATAETSIGFLVVNK